MRGLSANRRDGPGADTRGAGAEVLAEHGELTVGGLAPWLARYESRLDAALERLSRLAQE